LDKLDVFMQNEFCYAIFDNSPVNKGHTLIIPFRHFSSFFDSTEDEKYAILELLDKAKLYLDGRYNPDGYNIGINVGKHAGQTIFHLHIHLIPRYIGDIENPRGGVRGVIPEKRIY
jgi:diadenosine tetraphosphate (Ap4A) HIT family hydrolase